MRLSTLLTPFQTSVLSRLGSTAREVKNRCFDLDCPNKKWVNVQKRLDKHGFAVLQGKDSKISDLESVAKFLGQSQKHAHNDKTGITEIVGGSCSEQSSQVISSKEFSAHTDGSYLNGLIIDQKGKYRRVGPPSYVLLQCVKQADSGGANFLIDAQKILYSLILKRDPLLPILFSPVFSVGRGNHLVMDIPIFNIIESGRYRIRFSYDQDLYFSCKIQKEIERFNLEYIENKKYRTTCQLKEKQILIIDNFRCLHARSAFVGERFFRRLWIHDSIGSEEKVKPLLNQESYYASSAGQAFAIPYETFGVVGNAEIIEQQIQPGIVIPVELKEKLDKQLLFSPPFKFV